MIRIFIVDDHAVVRRGLKQIVSAEADMTVVGEAQDVEEMFRLIRKQDCDVLVTDISMPGRNGLQALPELKQEYPRLPVLVLSMHPEEQYAVQALRLGASGYLTKSSAAEELVSAIRKVVTGGRYVSGPLAEMLAMGLMIEDEPAPHETLSARELQFLCMLATGKSVGEIAERLSLSVKTVGTYRTRTLEKLAMKTDGELIHYAIRSRLVG